MTIDSKLDLNFRLLKVQHSSVKILVVFPVFTNFYFIISAAIPVASQENIIIDELLYIFSGVPGNFIVHQPVKETYDPRTFLISDDLDYALRQIVQQMLPLASNYSIVRRFVEHSNMWSGQVIHAFVAAIEVLLKDYYVSTEHIYIIFFIDGL